MRGDAAKWWWRLAGREHTHLTEYVVVFHMNSLRDE